MRCCACNTNLTDFESTRRSATGGGYLDMCGRCLRTIQVDVETVDNFSNYDPERDDLSTLDPILLPMDPIPDPLDRGAGPDMDEEGDGQ